MFKKCGNNFTNGGRKMRMATTVCEYIVFFFVKNSSWMKTMKKLDGIFTNFFVLFIQIIQLFIVHKPNSLYLHSFFQVYCILTVRHEPEKEKKMTKINNLECGRPLIASLPKYHSSNFFPNLNFPPNQKQSVIYSSPPDKQKSEIWPKIKIRFQFLRTERKF